MEEEEKMGGGGGGGAAREKRRGEKEISERCLQKSEEASRVKKGIESRGIKSMLEMSFMSKYDGNSREKL